MLQMWLIAPHWSLKQAWMGCKAFITLRAVGMCSANSALEAYTRCAARAAAKIMERSALAAADELDTLGYNPGTCPVPAALPAHKDSRQAHLEELGHLQELFRRFGARSSCSAGFALMSCWASQVSPSLL